MVSSVEYAETGGNNRRGNVVLGGSADPLITTVNYYKGPAARPEGLLRRSDDLWRGGRRRSPWESNDVASMAWGARNSISAQRHQPTPRPHHDGLGDPHGAPEDWRRCRRSLAPRRLHEPAGPAVLGRAAAGRPVSIASDATYATRDMTFNNTIAPRPPSPAFYAARSPTRRRPRPSPPRGKATQTDNPRAGSGTWPPPPRARRRPPVPPLAALGPFADVALALLQTTRASCNAKASQRSCGDDKILQRRQRRVQRVDLLLQRRDLRVVERNPRRAQRQRGRRSGPRLSTSWCPRPTTAPAF